MTEPATPARLAGVRVRCAPGSPRRAWLDAVEEVRLELSVPLAALRTGPGCDVADSYGDWARLSEIGETGCLLVRPDQHVLVRSPMTRGRRAG